MLPTYHHKKDRGKLLIIICISHITKLLIYIWHTTAWPTDLFLRKERGKRSAIEMFLHLKNMLYSCSVMSCLFVFFQIYRDGFKTKTANFYKCAASISVRNKIPNKKKQYTHIYGRKLNTCIHTVTFKMGLSILHEYQLCFVCVHTYQIILCRPRRQHFWRKQRNQISPRDPGYIKLKV